MGFLRKRNSAITEYMDAEDCDATLLNKTYERFSIINTLFCSWRYIYKEYFRPILKKKNDGATLLDIGCGGGDLSKMLVHWAAKDGILLRVTAIDTNAQAIKFAKSNHSHDNIEFMHCSTLDLLQEKKTFDIVISNHVLHHLVEDDIKGFLEQVTLLTATGGLSLMNDLKRSYLAYWGHFFISLLFCYKSYIRVDGLLSIRRSYIKEELKEFCSEKWHIDSLFPSRLIAYYYA